MRAEVAEARRSQLRLLDVVAPDIVAGHSVVAMRGVAARDRIQLANGFLGTADALLRRAVRQSEATSARSAISRYYYAMFQAARAVVFIAHQGDDHNDHQELPKRLPHQFPQRTYWVNQLKDARIARNEADYGPYPKVHTGWIAQGRQLKVEAHNFVALADGHLTTLGVAP